MTENGFQFALNQEVTLKAMTTPFLASSHQDTNALPQKMVVLSRWLEECEGGAQRHYDVRILQRETWGSSAGVLSTPFRFKESELMVYPTPAAQELKI